jgi:hypothetical protein
MALKKPEKIQFEIERKSADVQPGEKSFEKPSKSRCHPMAILRSVRAYNFIPVNLVSEVVDIQLLNYGVILFHV